MRKPADSSKRGRVWSAVTVAVVMAVWLPLIICASQPVSPAGPRPEIKPTIPAADRNQPNKVFLEHADRLHYNELSDLPPEEQYQVLTGNVKFRKGGMYMYCDSAFFYDAINSVDAFGSVRMEQGDTLFVYADELNYDGVNELAVLYADIGKKVRLINRDVKLETDVFNYDMAQDFGYYEVGGVLTDSQNRLESRIGEYYPQTKDAFFYYDVHLTSRQKNDMLYINTDTLEYNTASHVAELVSQSEVINSDGVIYSNSGTYNTDNGQADLYKRSVVVTRKGNRLTGDTLFYDRQKQYGLAYGNMILTDSIRQSSVQGDYGFFDDARDSTFVTGRALAKEYSKGDTLYLHGDSITAYLDLADSTKVTNVFHKVRFYRYDLQGLCDSLSVTERDSIMYLYRNPVVWSGRRQLFGSSINVHFNDSTVDWARLPLGGVGAEHVAEDCYNQISGKDMTAWFNDSTLRRLYVDGNVELIVFPMENDSSYNKFTYVESSYMDAYFNDKQIERINFWPETTSKVTPLYLAKRNAYFLPKFRWYEDLRPLTPADIFVVPEGMIELINSADPITPAQRSRNPKDSRPHPAAPKPVEKPDVAVMPSGDMTPAEDSELPDGDGERGADEAEPVSEADS